MIKNILSLVFLLFVSSTTYAQIGNFILQDLEGTPHELYQDLNNGKLVVLDFFFVGCGLCANFSPELEEMYQENASGQEEVVFYSIEVQEAPVNAIEDWESNLGTTYPVLHGSLAKLYWYNHIFQIYGGAFPQVLILKPGPNGGEDNETVYAHTGFVNEEAAAAMRVAIDANRPAPQEQEETNTAINDVENKININIFPNPSNEQLSIDLSDINAKKINLKIYNTNGQMVWENTQLNVPNSQTFNIDVSSLATGNYFLHIQDNDRNLQQLPFQIMR